MPYVMMSYVTTHIIQNLSLGAQIIFGTFLKFVLKPTDQPTYRPTYLSLDALLPKHKNNNNYQIVNNNLKFILISLVFFISQVVFILSLSFLRSSSSLEMPSDKCQVTHIKQNLFHDAQIIFGTFLKFVLKLTNHAQKLTKLEHF